MKRILVILIFINTNCLSQVSNNYRNYQKKIETSLISRFKIDSTKCYCENYHFTKPNDSIYTEKCNIKYYNKGIVIFSFEIDSIFTKNRTINNKYSISKVTLTDSELFSDILFYDNKSIDNLFITGKEGNLINRYDYYSNGELKRIHLTYQEEDTLLKEKYENGFPKFEIKIMPPSQIKLDSLNKLTEIIYNFFMYSNENNICADNYLLATYEGIYRNMFDYNGTYKTWYDNGQKQIVGQYSNNYQVGEWFFYASDGKLIRKTKFDNNGNVIKCKPCGNIDNMYFLKFAAKMTLDEWRKLGK